MPHSTRLAIFAFLLLFLGLVLYLPGLSGPLLFDDKSALTGNALVRIEGGSFDEWRAAALSSRSGILRRPIAMFSFAVNHVLEDGFSPTGLKTVNLVIHLLIAVLLYFFARVVIEAVSRDGNAPTRRLIALTAAAIWLLHPLNVSTVLYAVQRMAQLSALFVMAGMLVFVTYRQRWAERGAPLGEVLAVGLWLLLLTFLAMLCKENGALLPCLIVVLEVGVFRACWASRSNNYLHFSAWMILVLPVVAVVLVLSVSPDSLTGGYHYREFSLEERLMTQARLLWHYLGWIVFPNINVMGFQHDDIPLSISLFSPWTTALALLAWPVCLAIGLRLRKSWPLLLTALLFFLVGHSMESSFLPLEMAYEHRNYLPGVMVCIAVASLLVTVAARSARVGVWYPVLGAVLILSVLLFARVNTWSSELILSRTNVANHPHSSRSNYFYANALLRRYRQRDALGLDEQEAGESLLLARHYFERMYQSDNRDVAALVLLYYLDSQFFPELQQRVSWLEELERVLAVRVLQPSDWNALDTLMECFASGACAASPERVLALLDALSARYPGSAHILRYRYTYLSSRGADPDTLLPLLQDAQPRARTALWVYYGLLAQYAKTGEVDRMYYAAQQWLLYDTRRYNLPRLKALFEAAGGSAEVPGE